MAVVVNRDAAAGRPASYAYPYYGHAYPLSYGAIASYVNSGKEYDHDAIGGGRSVA